MRWRFLSYYHCLNTAHAVQCVGSDSTYIYIIYNYIYIYIYIYTYIHIWGTYIYIYIYLTGRMSSRSGSRFAVFRCLYLFWNGRETEVPTRKMRLTLCPAVGPFEHGLSVYGSFMLRARPFKQPFEHRDYAIYHGHPCRHRDIALIEPLIWVMNHTKPKE